MLDSLVKALQKAGLVKKRSKQRIDSTSVLACVSQMSRLEVVRETVRLFLQDLQKQDAACRPEGWQSLVERYCESEVDYRHLSEEGKMVAKLRQAGQDMLLLSRWLEGQEELQERQAARLLKRVLEEQFEVVEEEVEVCKTEVAGGVKTHHDPEAQWAAPKARRSMWAARSRWWRRWPRTAEPGKRGSRPQKKRCWLGDQGFRCEATHSGQGTGHLRKLI